ncbi:PREDICTED: uncharacterized protein LOC109590666, partial [Amphimedon queenslandica]|uniref:DUF6589 domain-containing protein n=1 Tax=Amphimedon queenslandica TaxID=400682 RepID=A0AAN0JYX9_AMPQE
MVSADRLHCLLIGGDQLTCKRIETAIELRQNGSTPIHALKGIQPVCEDWHAKKCLLEVIWKKFYDTKSFMDKGSMAQLRNLIDRRNISADSESDYNACDDFFTVVVECHIIAAAMQYLKMATINDQPSHSLLIGLAQLC